MTRPALRSALVMAALFVGVACGSEPPSDTEALVVSEGEATLEAATALGVPNARMPLPNLVTAGQPNEEQFDGLAAAGYQHFISLRPSSERGAGWEEEHSADGRFDFMRLPIENADALTRENVEAFAALMETVGDEPTVLYCGSSNRVGAMLALKAFWVDGADAEAAFELGQEAGMTRLADPVRELLGLDGGN